MSAEDNVLKGNATVLKGYEKDGEIYAVKKEYPDGLKTSLIVEVEPLPVVKKIYAAQKSRFTHRRNWGVLNKTND